MRLRIAKKIMLCSKGGYVITDPKARKHKKDQRRSFYRKWNKRRPPYYDAETGITYMQSLADVDVYVRAWNRLFRWLSRNANKPYTHEYGRFARFLSTQIRFNGTDKER